MMPDGEAENNYLYWSAIDVHIYREVSAARNINYIRPPVYFFLFVFAIFRAVTSHMYITGCRSRTISYAGGFLHVHCTEALMLQNCNAFFGNSVSGSTVIVVATLKTSPAVLCLCIRTCTAVQYAARKLKFNIAPNWTLIDKMSCSSLITQNMVISFCS
jgi:hypothetical protein